MKGRDMTRRMHFETGQVWRRRDGLRYSLSARLMDGWEVQVGRGVWRFSDRHLHNLVCSERLRLEPVTAKTVSERLHRAGLNRLGREVLALLPDSVPDAVNTKQVLTDKLDDASPEYREVLEESIDEIDDLLVEMGPRTTRPHRVLDSEQVSRDRVKEPNRITR